MSSESDTGRYSRYKLRVRATVRVRVTVRVRGLGVVMITRWVLMPNSIARARG